MFVCTRVYRKLYFCKVINKTKTYKTQQFGLIKKNLVYVYNCKHVFFLFWFFLLEFYISIPTIHDRSKIIDFNLV